MPGIGRPFEKGHAPLPGAGRPKGSKCPDWMKDFNEEGPLKKIALNPQDKYHFEAIKLIVAYKYGNPSQPIDATIEPGSNGTDAWRSTRKLIQLIEDREGTGVVEEFKRADIKKSDASFRSKRRPRDPDKNHRKK